MKLGKQPHSGRWKPWTRWRMLNHLFFDHGFLSDLDLGEWHRMYHVAEATGEPLTWPGETARTPSSTNEEL